jgi:FkbM family methyltransferase
MRLKNGLITLGMVPVKALTGSSWRDQLIYAKNYLGISQRVEREGLTWIVPGEVQDAVSALLIHERGATDALVGRFQPGQVFVDVGANVGGYSVRAAARGMTVYSFEPNPENLRLLKLNADVNRVSLNIFPDALGARSEKARLVLNGASSRISEREGIEVSMRTLDSFELPGADLMKVDAEGFEFDVLQGAVLTLRRFHPSLMIEMHDWAGAEKDAGLLGLLSGFGYKLEYLDRFSKGRHLSAVWKPPSKELTP